ncbi:MAG: polysulfide reductase NrfD, molybdopterin oxidoreductase, membrane subunit [Candidatus Rokubacteria bacterium CSP1-6]|nr:MAG: polysulfide reductase NrfD, molybdopterin oxidoreductase, membrane subunit [Candidatus Rokubacteria bacterium CSP1-6]
MADPADTRDAALLAPIERTGRGFYWTVGLLSLLILWGAVAYWTQFDEGLGVTGLHQPVSWGFYVTNFVFFIGISHAGTLISAILRLSKAEWRRPITRMAEVITVMVLFIGAGQILVDLGRPDRMMNIIRYGRYQSPLLWDATSISAYLTASMIYLYIPMIPDIAILRDRVRKRKLLYSVLAMGWTGSEHQQKVLNRAIAIMAVLVIPIAVSVHTVVSFVFSMTLQPMWRSTIFGPYFVVGAIFSGIAALIVAMLVFRKAYGLHGYLKPIHFRYLGQLLLVMSLLWFYFTFAEYLTAYYGNEPEEMHVFWAKFSGPFWPFFWGMAVTNFVIPVLCLVRLGRHTIGKVLTASLSVTVGMWLERFIIVVPTLSNPRLPFGEGIYFPTWVEWGELAGSFALFALFFVLFTKLFPVISIWEIREGREVGLKEVEERLLTYLPETAEPRHAEPERGW